MLNYKFEDINIENIDYIKTLLKFLNFESEENQIDQRL